MTELRVSLLLLLFAISTHSASAAAYQPFITLDGGIARLSGFETERAWRISGGYRITRRFALEADFTALGIFHANSGPEAEMRLDGNALNAVGFLPLGPSSSVMGRVGAFFWDRDGVLAGEEIPEDRGIIPTVGLGAMIRLSPRWSMHLRADHYAGLEDLRKERLSVTTYAAGLGYWLE